jgi:glycosyltransferase involved in cell wall biosynthesis
VNVLDVHFGYPDGAAGRYLARWLGLPMVLTLRGKEERLLRTNVARPLRRAVMAADQLVTVSQALCDIAIELGADARRVTMIGNGVDLAKFSPVPQAIARRELQLPAEARVLISVGSPVERKGFHRVIECLPMLLMRHPDLHYVVVGAAGPEGDMSAQLQAQVASLGLQDRVHFVGAWAPERLKVPLSAADVFVLASSYEGWANVFLEAMACGLPVVTTRVGGNAEVVCSPDVGTLVPFGDRAALTAALHDALCRHWNRPQIVEYARANSWDRRIPLLLEVLQRAQRGLSSSNEAASGICAGEPQVLTDAESKPQTPSGAACN